MNTIFRRGRLPGFEQVTIFKFCQKIYDDVYMYSMCTQGGALKRFFGIFQQCTVPMCRKWFEYNFYLYFPQISKLVFFWGKLLKFYKGFITSLRVAPEYGQGSQSGATLSVHWVHQIKSLNQTKKTIVYHCHQFI